MNLADAAIVAIGSNLGDSVDIVSSAIERLRNLSDRPILVSSLYQTEPVDCPSGSPPFTNAIVALKPRRDETAESLLTKLHSLEQEFGRQRSGTRNEARTLDLDLIAFGPEVRSSPALTLPHPRAHQRAFVLTPLSEIAADYVLPLQTQSVKALLDALGGQGVEVQRLGNPRS